MNQIRYAYERGGHGRSYSSSILRQYRRLSTSSQRARENQNPDWMRSSDEGDAPPFFPHGLAIIPLHREGVPSGNSLLLAFLSMCCFKIVHFSVNID